MIPIPFINEDQEMWYFAWILGVLFAASFAVINAMWLESVCDIDGYKADDACDTLQKPRA